MSHRWDCPDRWTAKREGALAFENGSGSWTNPYKEDWPDSSCPEAEGAWRDGFRNAERREEERQEEERHQRQVEQRRREELAYEEMYLQAQYEEQEQQLEEPAPDEGSSR